MRLTVLLLFVLTAGSTLAATQADKPTVIIVVGAEGAAEYRPLFASWADRWITASKQASANVIVIGHGAGAASEATSQPGRETGIDRERLRQVLAAEVGAAPATQPATLPASEPTSQPAATSPASYSPLWLVLIGHGTFNGREAKFNLSGDDVSDLELASWLAPARRPLAILNCTSASAPFLNRLSGPDRVVVVATRSGNEIQFARFGEYLSAAITSLASDLDKDGQTSLLEAYIAASHQTEAYYKEAGRLATEHALLDDNGDSLGTPATWFEGTRATQTAKTGASTDGPRAHQWHLLPSATEQAIPPGLRARRDSLELQIQALRDRKSTLPEADYYAQLEPLLLDLARIYDSANPTTVPATSTTTTP